MYFSPVTLTALLLPGIFVILKIWTKLTTGWCNSFTCLVGKTVIVTGGNTGVGYATALDFAKRGARVILACKDEKTGEAARVDIIEETGNSNVVVKLIDLSSFASVRAFAKDINANEARLDILVNNAGIFGNHKMKSVDGYNTMMQINYFSAFLLTNLLIELLKKSGPSRVVNVASLAAKWAYGFSLDKINQTEVYNMYAYSKLCNILFIMELAKRLDGTGVTVYSLHPGFVDSDLFRFTTGLKSLLIGIGRRVFAKTLEEGAQTSLHCSLTKGIEKHSGQYFSDCKRVDQFNIATVKGLSEELWRLSEKIVKLKPEESIRPFKLE